MQTDGWGCTGDVAASIGIYKVSPLQPLRLPDDASQSASPAPADLRSWNSLPLPVTIMKRLSGSVVTVSSAITLPRGVRQWVMLVRHSAGSLLAVAYSSRARESGPARPR